MKEKIFKKILKRVLKHNKRQILNKIINYKLWILIILVIKAKSQYLKIKFR
jgi:hypothetical protein